MSKKSIRWKVGISCVVALGSSTVANAGVDLVGAGTYSLATGSDGTPTSKIGFPGGGLTLNFRASRRVHLELGGLYLTRIYTTDSDQTTRILQGRAGLKFYFSRSFYLNMGGFMNHLLSSSEGLTGTDAGAYVGFGLKFLMSQQISLLINPQYQYAINSLTSSSGYTVKPSEFVGLIGFSFGI